jgi:hypothetical protein
LRPTIIVKVLTMAHQLDVWLFADRVGTLALVYGRLSELLFFLSRLGSPNGSLAKCLAHAARLIQDCISLNLSVHNVDARH